MADLPENIRKDVEIVKGIPAIPSLLEVICQATGMGFATVTRVTPERWVVCSVRDQIAFGLGPGDELKVETTICHEIRQSNEPVVIDHVEKDEQYNCHPTPAMYGFQSYISIPIFKRDGSFFGTLCAIDPKPVPLKNEKTIGMFRLFADLISFHIEAVEKLQNTEDKLVNELKTAELREHFIAILGHDLRNPLGATRSSAELLLQKPLDETGTKLVKIIQNSAYRMTGLIDNVMDFARGRMGNGISLNKERVKNIGTTLNQTVSELQITAPDYFIETEFHLVEDVYCDKGRIAQLLSNLLGNAVAHGNNDAPIQVKASCVNGSFRLSVTNSGEKIPDSIIDRLFQPFSRNDFRPGQEGLGLGLYISSEIAHAHGGKLIALSTEEETTFTFEMPAELS